jgi:hypothetical protein
MRYSENPNLDLQVVDTVNGKKEYRNNCRKIKNKDGVYCFYIKNEDCYFIDGTWYRLETGKIIFDSEKNCYTLANNENLVKGVVGFDGDSPIHGHYTQNIYKNCRIIDRNGKKYPCISYEIIPSSYQELPGYDMFEQVSSKTNKKVIANGDDYKNGHYNYNIDDDPMSFESLKEIYKNSKFKIDKELFKYGRVLNNMTYGMELESIKGYLPKYFRNKFGIQICRDGSLSNENGDQGPEYVTVPMKGARGLQNIKNFSKEIALRNDMNYNCSLHIHIGNIRKDRTFLVALYKASVSIQNELFKMFPFYKNDEIKYAGKQKNYCKKLKKLFDNYEGSSKADYDKYINNSYSTLGQLLLGNHAVPNFNFNRTNGQHPQKNKWERTGRYYWINFMNMFFSKRDTIEFRLHTPTFNSQKIINWLFICSAFIQYVEKHTEAILKGKKIKIKDVLYIYKDLYNEEELSEYLLDYYKSRVVFFEKLTKSGNFIPSEELACDSAYFFESKLNNIF